MKGAFHQRLEDYLFHFSFHNLRSEDTFRTLLQSLLLQMGRPTQSEKSTLGGRADHEIRFGHRMYVFEVKYNQSLGAARRQIRNRQYGREHLNRGLEVVAVSLNLRRNKDDITLECETDVLGELLGVRDEVLPGDGGDAWSQSLTPHPTLRRSVGFTSRCCCRHRATVRPCALSYAPNRNAVPPSCV